MRRYIDANALIEKLKHNLDFLTAPKHSKDGIIDEIVYQPTADVVEVTRCKDCLYSYFNTSSLRYTCQREYPRRSVEEEDFCNHGRNKSTEEGG